MYLIACIQASLSFIRRRCLLHQKMILTMKLTTILMFATCLHIHAAGFGQNITLSEQNAPLKKILKEIRQQSGYSFFYEDRLLERSRPVSLTVKDQPLEDVLSTVFRNQPLTYEILGKVIAIKAKKETVASPSPQITAAAPVPVRITGIVKDEDGNPLAGATISIKNSNVTTVSKPDGTFEIEAPDENATLVVSFVGYGKREIALGSNRTASVVLTREVTQMENLVVVGYGKQKARDLTGSISSVKGEQLAKMPSTNPISSLQGRVPGLTVANSGRAGSSPVVRIRGVNSTNSAGPVYVVDGILQDNIDFLNPADIESIDVLRDPSSIAIYGLRGANGVIAVTLKKAAKGQTRINFTTTTGIQKVQDKIALTDAAGFKKLYSAQLANLNSPAFDFANFTANTNWQDLILRDASFVNTNLSISNNSEKSSTYINIGYTNQDGVVKYDNYKRYLARLNEEIRFNNNIKVGGDLTAYYRTSTPPGVSITNALWAAPIVPVQYNERTYYSMPSFQRAQVSNPIAALNRANKTSVDKGYRVIGSLFAEVKFLKYFTWKSTVYADLEFNNSRSYSPLPFRFINIEQGGGITDTTFDNSVRTSVSQSQDESRRFQQDHTLSFEKRIGHHNITALAGLTTIYAASSSLGGTRRDTSLNIPNDPDYWYLNIVNVNNPLNNSGGGSESAIVGSFARLSYSFSGKYLLNATIRRDGSSKFAPQNRWGTFGSVGLGWVVSDEKFFSNVKNINFLKLRGAWGLTGNANGFADFLYKPGVSNASTAIFADNIYTSVQAAYIPDPNLHWETVNGIDVGLDLRALSNRLNVEATYYNRTTKDLLTAVSIPNDSRQKFTNLGKITNKGIEISAGWNDRIGKDFTYGASANFSYNKNVVNAIGDNFNFEITGNGGVNLTRTGNSIGYFYGYKQVGVYQSAADLTKMPALSTSLPGDIAYADINGDGVITPADRGYIGTPFPPYSFGGSINVGYKGFDLEVQGQGFAGHKIYAQRRTATFTVLNYEANRLNAWTGAGTTNIEPILDNARGNNFLMSTYFLEPGDFFRLRFVQLTYTLQGNLKRYGLNKAQFFVSGQNIKTWSRVTGYSPEPIIGSILGGGADNGSYPVPAVYSVGINLGF